jgi:hypothetical protein
MTYEATTRRIDASRATDEAATTKTLLACGTVAGPLFIVVGFAAALTRTGFELSKHPLSLLSVGDLGCIQIANFVVAGLLFVASAVGVRRALHAGLAGTWGPWLIGIFGVSSSPVPCSSRTRPSASHPAPRRVFPTRSAGTPCCTPLLP